MTEPSRHHGYVEIEGLPEGLHVRVPADASAPTPGPIEPGGYFEDCRYHPVLCVRVDYGEDDIVGISLVDGSSSGCSLSHCGVRKLSFEQAVAIKRQGLNWTTCRYCGHHQVDHRDLDLGGCDAEDGCECDRPWAPAEGLWGGF